MGLRVRGGDECCVAPQHSGRLFLLTNNTTCSVGEAWEEFTGGNMNSIIRCFRKLGLSLPIDGQRDTELDIKGLPGIQVGNWMNDTTTDDIYMDMGTEDNEHPAIEYVADSERS